MAVLYVFLGGGLGAVLRYGVATALPRAGAAAFPWATLAVNLVGSLLIGALAGLLAGKDAARAFGIVGVLGGFTTFSAFSLDALDLLQSGRTGAAVAYVFASVLGGLALAWLGWTLGNR